MDVGLPLASLAHCREVTRIHAKSFYFASRVLPVRRRDAAYAVYAFCRYADDAMDEAGAGAAGVIGRLAEEYDRIVAGEAGGWEFAPAFAWAAREFGLEKRPFMELLEGVLMDRGSVRVATWVDLRDYCWHVASTVGLVMARIFGLSDPRGVERAEELGIAMQLTNILRDVREDYGRDRIYLPREERERFGVSEDDLRYGRMTDGMRAMIRHGVERARGYYARSEEGIGYLADDGSRLAVWLMRHVYAGILDEIERADYDVFRRRAATSTPAKLRLAWRAWGDLRRSRERDGAV